MAKRRARPAPSKGFGQTLPQSAVGKSTKTKHHSGFANTRRPKPCYLGAQVSTAVFYFLRRRLVLWRQTLNHVGHSCAHQPCCCWVGRTCESGCVQRRKQKVTRRIAYKDSPRAVSAQAPRGKANQQQLCAGVSSIRYRCVVVVRMAVALLVDPTHQPRAGAARQHRRATITHAARR